MHQIGKLFTIIAVKARSRFTPKERCFRNPGFFGIWPIVGINSLWHIDCDYSVCNLSWRSEAILNCLLFLQSCPHKHKFNFMISQKCLVSEFPHAAHYLSVWQREHITHAQLLMSSWFESCNSVRILHHYNYQNSQNSALKVSSYVLLLAHCRCVTSCGNFT